MEADYKSLGKAAPYRATMLPDGADRQVLKEAHEYCWKRRTIWRPQFFLASVSRPSWRPNLTIIREGSRLAGIVYAKERCVFGIPSGIIYGDGSLHTMIVADRAGREPVFQAAIENMLRTPGVRAIRMVLPPGGFEIDVLSRLAAERRWEISYGPVENHIIVPLPGRYEEFLQSASYKTRRNLRYYRRQFEQAGGVFVDRVDWSDFHRAAWALRPKSRIAPPLAAMARPMNVLWVAGQPILAGLRSRSGDWLGLAGGWRDGDRAVLFFQLNDDRHHPRASLSTVLRSYFIEMLISLGVRDLVLWGGSAGPISRLAYPIPAVAVHVDKPSGPWRSVRWMLSAAAKWAPPAVANRIRWILPAPHASPANLEIAAGDCGVTRPSSSRESN